MSVKKQRDIIEVGDLSFIKYIDAQEIEKKVQEIADSIREDYHEKYPMFLESWTSPVSSILFVSNHTRVPKAPAK